jgi:hypothetical protein
VSGDEYGFYAEWDAQKQPPQPPQPPTANGVTPSTAYAQAALQAELAILQATPEGERNEQLNKSGYSLYQLVAAGALHEATVDDQLTNTAHAIGLTVTETRNTIASAKAGLNHPRTIPESTSSNPPPVTTLNGTQPDSDIVGWRVQLTAAGAIHPKPVHWFWEERLALGTLGLLAGDVGLGKSMLSCWVAARASRGQLPGEYHNQPKAVLICAAEDSWAHTIVPRLIAADADLDKVFRVEVATPEGVTTGLSLPRDLAELERAAVEQDAALLILDPLISRLSNALDTHRDGDVRNALEPMVTVAETTRMAVLGLIHHNKSGSVDPLQLVMASKAFTAVARSVHSVIRDPDDETEKRRLFGSPKNNLGREDLATLAFVVASHVIDTDEGPANTGRLDWVGEVDGTISDAMRRGRDEDRTATAEAADWLEDYLAQNGGTAPSADIKRDGRKAGHVDHTLKRARQRIRAEVSSVGFPRVSWWSLPVTQIGVSGLSSRNTARGSQSEQFPRGESPNVPTGQTRTTNPPGEEETDMSDMASRNSGDTLQGNVPTDVPTAERGNAQ